MARITGVYLAYISLYGRLLLPLSLIISIIPTLSSLLYYSVFLVYSNYSLELFGLLKKHLMIDKSFQKHYSYPNDKT
jgi:hypothetical protein